MRWTLLRWSLQPEARGLCAYRHILTARYLRRRNLQASTRSTTFSSSPDFPATSIVRSRTGLG
eukprot:10443001-Heterocapsa_arctica.AAC.1